MNLIQNCALLLFTTLVFGAGSASAAFNLRQLGAKGDGITDDTEVFNRAMAQAVLSGSGAEVVIPAGKYRLSKSVQISKADGLVVRGEKGTVLVMDNADAAMMILTDCKNLVIRALSFDRNPLSLTQGTILSVDPKAMTCTVHLDPGYPAPDAPQLAEARLYPFVYPESGTYQLDRYIPEVASRQKIGGQEWLFTLKGHAPTLQWAGQRFFFAHFGRGHCFVGRGLRDCLFEDLNYWGGGGDAGLYLDGLYGTITFRKFVIGVPPDSNRMAACSGGGQIGNIRGKLVFENCDFSKIDDDGLDILGNWTRVLEQKDKRTLLLQTNRNFQAGDHVAIWDWKNKQRRQEAVVKEARGNPDKSFTILLDREVLIERAGAGDGTPFGSVAREDGIDRVINMDTLGESTLIRNCRFQVFRAKCLNLKAKNCTVEGCTFFNSWQPAVSAAAEWYFQEGPPIRNLVVRNNRFMNCNHSNIEIGVGGSQVRIEGNAFEGYGAHSSVFPFFPVGNAIRVQNAAGVTIRSNTFGPPSSTAPKDSKPVIIESAPNVVLKGNKCVSNKAQ